jgi:hypothetical protein
MKRHDIIDGIQTVFAFTLIFAVFIIAMVMFSGCSSTQLCSAYKDKPKIERVRMKSHASDPHPRLIPAFRPQPGSR